MPATARVGAAKSISLCIVITLLCTLHFCPCHTIIAASIHLPFHTIHTVVELCCLLACTQKSFSSYRVSKGV